MNKRTRMLLSGVAVVIGTVMHYAGRDGNQFVMALGITLEVVGVVSFLMAVAKPDAR